MMSAVFVAAGAVPPSGALAAPCHVLAPGVLERVATTEAPRPRRSGALPAAGLGVLGSAGFVVVAAGLSDPGNLGTILRTAEAAGADAVALTPDTVDVTNPKVVRALRARCSSCPSSTRSSWGRCARWGCACSALRPVARPTPRST